MKPRAFLDTNVFIYAYEFPASNSARVIELLNRGEIEGVIFEQVLHEVQRYFKQHYGKEVAGLWRNYLLVSCVVIPREQVEVELLQYRGRIKEKDLEQLAVTKKFGLKFLVSYDRDFEGLEEYHTPKQFIESLGLESAAAEEF